MRKPVRLQLSRAKGYNLQAASQSLNGLPAVIVSRPGKWGNPFKVTTLVRPGTRIGLRDFAVGTAEEAVLELRKMLADRPGLAARVKAELRGKNLACWCGLEEPCHADVLLKMANR